MTAAPGPEFMALQQALIGRYSLERELGRGGMGIVFLARDVALDRPVAIKLLPPERAADPSLRARFITEARVAAQLSQPNIVPIHAVEERDSLVYFVMSYIEGETLGERLRGRGPLTPREAARLVQEVAWALGYAHGRGVVHRDIKPDNIIMERGTGRAVVMDFGIASTAAAPGTGEVIGTASYMSPEQAQGEPVDGRSDLYSMGVVAFLAVSGRLPFESADPTETLAMHVTRPAPPVGSLAAGLPRALSHAIDRCLAKSPADRFPTGEALAEAVGQGVEPKRELPVPLRLWLTKGREHKIAYLLWFPFAGPAVAWPTGYVVGSVLGEAAGIVAGIGIFMFGPFLIEGAYRTFRLRVLLKAGYSVDDARLAVKDYAEQRREELTYEYGAEPPAWAKAARGLMFASGLTVIGSMVVTFFWPVPPAAVGITALVSGATLLGTAVLQVIRPGRRITSDRAAEWRLRFWNSRFAKWFEKLARFGLKPRSSPAELTYRPTELAISLAADALFESLPKDTRKELGALPQLIARLQSDAALMRRTVDELNEALSGLGERGDAETGAVRDKLRSDLVARRDQAMQRMGAAVSALERIRLNLLRLKAGSGTVSEVTRDLEAAGEVNAELELQAEARAEVSALLAAARRESGSHKAVTRG